jgi:hypothetical protein
MLKINLVTESYRFKNKNEYFRAIPFYNLANNELIIYEDGEPKYFIDTNDNTTPVVQLIEEQADDQTAIDQIIHTIGQNINHNWTTKYSIVGQQVANSCQTETVELYLLTDLAELMQAQ